MDFILSKAPDSINKIDNNLTTVLNIFECMQHNRIVQNYYSEIYKQGTGF